MIGKILEKAKGAGIKVYKRNIENLIAALEKSSNFWEMLDYADIPITYAAKLIKILEDEGLVKIEGEKILLTERGKELAKEGVKFYDFVCKACEGRGVPFYADKELYKLFLQAAAERPEMLQKYDQGAVTPETTIARVLFMMQRGDLENKRIMVMGAEDDLNGLAIALTKKAKEVVILDIDERLIKLVNKWVDKLGIENAKAEVFDLRNPFPEEYLHKFDVFVTDPPETIAAFQAFVERGFATIKHDGGVGYFGLTLKDSSIFRWKQFQEILLKNNAVITDIIQDFCHYMNWEYFKEMEAFKLSPTKILPKKIWYKSAWYRLEILPGFKSSNEKISDEVFYLDEEGSTT